MSRRTDAAPFDRWREPPRQNLFFMPLIWLLSRILAGWRVKISRSRMKGLKPPYLVLCTHHSFMDFYITPLALFPHRANYISELEGFENYGEWLYRQAGCLGTRKFVGDVALVKNIRRVIKRGDILVMYPEARYANAGTSCVFPDTVGRLAKSLDVPVVTLNMRGNYLQSPIWNLRKRRGVPLESTITQIFTREELQSATVDQVNAAIRQALDYDEYAWQYERGIKIDEPWRAEGLEDVLYRCPCCETDFAMAGKGAELFCNACGARWEMTVLGRLEPVNDKACGAAVELSHIPHWYEWQRTQVEAEISRGEYRLDTTVGVESLPGTKSFIKLGQGRLIHDYQGFRLTFRDHGREKEETVLFSAAATFSIHTEYNYRDKWGPCITLSTPDNTYFLYPTEPGFNPTKIQFAAEFFHKLGTDGGEP